MFRIFKKQKLKNVSTSCETDVLVTYNNLISEFEELNLINAVKRASYVITTDLGIDDDDEFDKVMHDNYLIEKVSNDYQFLNDSTITSNYNNFI